MGFITVDELKGMPTGIKPDLWAKIEAGSATALQEAIDTASAKVEDFTKRKFAETEYVEEHYGFGGRSGGRFIILNHYPVRSIESITYEDVTENPSVVTVDTDRIRFTESGIVSWRDYTRWGPWFGSRLYTFTYTAGYDPIPGPIRQATALWAVEVLQPFFAGLGARPGDTLALTSEQIVDLLADYRRDRIA